MTYSIERLCDVSLVPSAHDLAPARPATRWRDDAIVPDRPAVEDDTANAQPAPFAPAQPLLKGLIIDDDPFVGVAIKTILARKGWDMVLSLRAHAGIHAFESSAFDLVLVDLFMPGMTGFDTIFRIRQLASAVSIVAMTGFEFPESEESSEDFLGLAVQRGANCGVRKPFSCQQLMAAINSTLPLAPQIGGPPP